ncbi:hypothetical protein ACX3PU_02920 [Chryseobacterium sp. A301]
MKTILILALFILFCSAQNLQAQVYLFETTQSAEPIDDGGKHVFSPSNLNFQFDVDGMSLSIFLRPTNEFMIQQAISKDVEIKVKPEKSEYVIGNGLQSYFIVTDYKDSDLEDEMQFFELTKEILHMKGKFQKVNHKKQ